MSHPDDQVLEETSSDSFYPGKIEHGVERGGVLEAEESEFAQAEIGTDEEIQMEPQPGFTSARRSDAGSGPRARPHRTRPSRLDSIDAHDFSGYEAEQPRQVTVSLLPSDLKLIDDLRLELAGQHGEELTGGEVIRLALRCFKAKAAPVTQTQEFRPQIEESSIILTS